MLIGLAGTVKQNVVVMFDPYTVFHVCGPQCLNQAVCACVINPYKCICHRCCVILWNWHFMVLNVSALACILGKFWKISWKTLMLVHVSLILESVLGFSAVKRLIDRCWKHSVMYPLKLHSDTCVTLQIYYGMWRMSDNWPSVSEPGPPQCGQAWLHCLLACLLGSTYICFMLLWRFQCILLKIFPDTQQTQWARVTISYTTVDREMFVVKKISWLPQTTKIFHTKFISQPIIASCQWQHIFTQPLCACFAPLLLCDTWIVFLTREPQVRSVFISTVT